MSALGWPGDGPGGPALPGWMGCSSLGCTAGRKDTVNYRVRDGAFTPRAHRKTDTGADHNAPGLFLTNQGMSSLIGTGNQSRRSIRVAGTLKYSNG